jgi:hypothetical protein
MAKTMPEAGARAQQRTQIMTRGESLAEPANPPRSPEARSPSAEAPAAADAINQRVENYRRGDR